MKMPLLLVGLLVGMTTCAQWTILNVPTSGRYDDIFFINENQGWAADGEGQIIATTDGGQTWLPQFVTNKYLRSIEFLNDRVGFCGSLDSSLYKTINGGSTWVDIAPSITPKPPGICGLSAPSQQVVYGCGAWFSPAYVIKSMNGGTTWTNIDMSAYASALVDIHFVDDLHGFVSGRAANVNEGGIILYTADGGQTWEIKHKTMVPNDYVWKLQSPDGLHFFASVEGYPNANNVRMVKSTDAGGVWETVLVSNTYSYVQMVGFLNANHGWIGGNNAVYETFDGGASWTPTFIGSTYNRFFKVNEYTAYLTGTRIYKYIDGDASTPELEPHDDLHSLECTPNPVSDELTVTLTLADDSRCKLDLIGLDGRIIRTIFDDYGKQGEQVFKLDLRNLEPQTVFVVLQSNEGTIFRKLVVQ